MATAAEMFRDRAKARVGTFVRDKWRLDALLGIGGTAAVYAATHRNGKRVAIKILRSELASYDEVTVRFAREGYVANKIDHPGVVSVLDDDITEDGAPFLVMDLLEGHSLDRYTRSGASAMPAGRVLEITAKVLEVLAAAHAKGIVHRDIKPANLFLTNDDDVRVLDFGIARIVDALDGGMTQTGTAIGTPGYMAPEQARGRWNEVDARTDLWALGATMYALLIGRRPRRADTVQEELLAAMTQPMPPIEVAYAGLEAARAPLPPGLAELINRAVAFEREGRFQDAGEMLLALRELRRGEPVATMVSPPREPMGGDDAEQTVATGPSWQHLPDLSGATAYPLTVASNPTGEPVAPSPRNNTWVWITAAVLLTCAALGVGWMKLRAPAEAPLAMPPSEVDVGVAPAAAAAAEPPSERLPEPPIENLSEPPSTGAEPGAAASEKVAQKPAGVASPKKAPTAAPRGAPKPNAKDPCKDPDVANRPPSCF